jgi:hypothetical protein
MELWKTININKDYEISTLGNVRITKNGECKYLNFYENHTKDYYKTINIDGKSFKIHRLVAEAYIEKNIYIKTEVNHINGIKYDNRVDNLEWVTHKENVQHAFDTGLTTPLCGENHPNSRVTQDIVDYVFKLHTEQKISSIAIGGLINFTKYIIQRILNKTLKGYIYPKELMYIKRKAKNKTLTGVLLSNIREDLLLGNMGKDVAKKYNISRSSVSRIKNKLVTVEEAKKGSTYVKK